MAVAALVPKGTYQICTRIILSLCLSGIIVGTTFAIGILKFREFSAKLHSTAMPFFTPTEQKGCFSVNYNKSIMWQNYPKEIWFNFITFHERPTSDLLAQNKLPNIKPSYIVAIERHIDINFNDIYYMEKFDVGLPFRCFSGAQAWTISNGGPVMYMGINLIGESSPSWIRDWLKKRFPMSSAELPVLPSYVSFWALILNILFWAPFGYGIVSVPRLIGAIRGWFRRRRGLCVCCGYPVQIQDKIWVQCSECGRHKE